jgi:hypothetical protein
MRDHRGIQIAFSYPSGGTVTDEFNQSMAGLLLYEASKKQDQESLVDCRHLGSMIFNPPGCYVSVNRSKAVIQLLNSPAMDTHLLMIDTDISFPHNLIDLLVAHLAEWPEIDILAGRVNIANGYPVFYKEEYKAFVQQIQPFHGVREFDYVGTGIICISRSCLYDLTEKEGHGSLFLHQLREDKREIGDDFSFCTLARKHGYKIYGAWALYGQHYKNQPVKQLYPNTIIELAPSFKGK